MSLREVLATHRVVVCVGAGGVGKTTTAAALAVAAALEGRRVLCLTIDPARRLATSLGLGTMSTEEQAIDPAIFAARGLTMKGSLSAMMLDTKGTFDELVRRTASSPERATAILENRLYQYISTSLAGVSEYMAMEKLHAVRNDPRFDLIVLDTPPTSNALDFLDAPERLSSLIDSPAMRWIVEAVGGAGRFSLGLVGKGAKLVLSGLSRFTGSGFLETIAVFLTEFDDLFGGFRKRAEEVAAAFREPDVGFVVVTSPAPLAVEEALFFSRRLGEADMKERAFVVNQVHRSVELPAPALRALVKELDAVPGPRRPLGARVERALGERTVQAKADALAIGRLRSEVGGRAALIEVPVLAHDVHDLDALHEVGRYLVG